MADAPTFTEGLRDAIVGKSRICDVNGEDGKLIYAGYDIHDLAQNTTFEEVVFLLWHGKLPAQAELKALNADLDAHRALPDAALAVLKSLPVATAPPMDVLRTAVSLLGLYDPDTGDDTPAANTRKAVRLTAQMGTVVAALARLKAGQEPIAPKAGLRTAANFLYQLKGTVPTDLEAHALDVALILHADHELNASTFAARVTIATLTDVYSAVVSAIGALAGPLHGGANVNVMRTLEKISGSDPAAVVTEMLAGGQKIPGIGHAVYKALDPRAVSLREMSRLLAEATGDSHWFDLSEAVQQAADKALAARGKTTLKANVDFFSASVYHMLGIPTEQFTPVFAVARIAGWTAHILEQLENNKIMRPRAIYVGPRDLRVAPIAERG